MAAQWRTGDGAPYGGGCVSHAREGGDALPYRLPIAQKNRPA